MKPVLKALEVDFYTALNAEIGACEKLTDEVNMTVEAQHKADALHALTFEAAVNSVKQESPQQGT
jgi:hypothetical protein